MDGCTDGLALSGNAPRIFSRTTGHGLPWLAVLFDALFAFLAFMSLSASSAKVFQWFQNLSSVAGLMTWFGIALTYIRFNAGLKAQGFDRKRLPYYNWIAPYAAWYCLIGTFVICLFSGFKYFLKNGWDTAGFITNYLSFILFFILYGVGKLVYRVPTKKATDMDFYSGLDAIEADTYDEPPPRNALEKFWAWLM